MKQFDETDLINQPIDSQISYMKEWFYENYEDPANNCPYESRAGGYQYIWGGPYDADEVLIEKFENIASQEALDELISELNSISADWSGRPDNEDYHDYYFNVLSTNTTYHKTLFNNLNDISKLLSINISENDKKLLYKVLYVNIITNLESFLAEAFIQTVLENEDLLKKFVGGNPDFSKRKLTLNELFTRVDGIKKEVGNYLLDMVWHDLAKVKRMFESTFNIKIEGNLTNLFKSIKKRHDIVHRNGKTKEGKVIKISETDINTLIKDVKNLANNIDTLFTYKSGL